MTLNNSIDQDEIINEPFAIIVLFTVILTIIFIISLILNIISIKSILSSNEFTTINTLIMNLAFADLVYSCGIPFFIYQFYSYNWLLGELGCRLFIFFEFSGLIVGIFTICALSIERYFDVTSRIKIRLDKYSNKFKVFITIVYSLLIWLFSLAFTLPFVISISLFKHGHLYSCHSNWNDSTLKVYFTFKFSATFIVPYSIILICSMQVLIFLIKWKIRSTNMSSELMLIKSPKQRQGCFGFRKLCDRIKNSKYESVMKFDATNNQTVCLRQFTRKRGYLNSVRRKAIRLVLFIVLIFVIQWSPLWIFQFVVIFSKNDFENIQLINMFASTLSYSNTIANPLIYLILTSNFKNYCDIKLRKMRLKQFI